MAGTMNSRPPGLSYAAAEAVAKVAADGEEIEIGSWCCCVDGGGKGGWEKGLLVLLR